jgi:hypothetical protein
MTMSAAVEQLKPEAHQHNRYDPPLAVNGVTAVEFGTSHTQEKLAPLAPVAAHPKAGDRDTR